MEPKVESSGDEINSGFREMNEGAKDEPQPGDWSVSIIRRFAKFSVVFLLIALTMGFLCMCQGVFEFVGLEFRAPGHHDSDATSWVLFAIGSWLELAVAEPSSHSAISTIMGGLEFFLLAPLGYVLLHTLANYVSAFHNGTRNEKYEAALRDVMSVKSLTAGLLIAVLGTHLVSIFLHKENKLDGDFPTTHVTCGVAVLLALIIYLWAIEHVPHERVDEKEKEERMARRFLGKSSE